MNFSAMNFSAHLPMFYLDIDLYLCILPTTFDLYYRHDLIMIMSIYIYKYIYIIFQIVC